MGSGNEITLTDIHTVTIDHTESSISLLLTLLVARIGNTRHNPYQEPDTIL